MSARAALPRLLLGLLPIVLILALWQGLTASGMAPPSLLPPPAAVFARLAEQLGNPIFLQHAATTLFRLFAGFAIAVAIGVALGVAATGSRAVEALVGRWCACWRRCRRSRSIRRFILILGFEHASKIALVVADAVFPILLATYQGTTAVEPKLVWSALRGRRLRAQALFTVVLPAALPSVLTGCRIGLVISCIVVFLAEMITSTDGLGHLLV